MNINDYDKIELQFEEFHLTIPKEFIEKFQIDKVEQLIEKKYNPEDIYNVYIVINRTQLEERFEKELQENSDEIEKDSAFYDSSTKNMILQYKNLTECINSNHIYDINIYKDKKIIGTYSPVWSYTEFENEYQRIGITKEKIIIRIKEL